jgi:hypothetical protein
VVDANLIHSNWYPKYLKSERGLKMSFPDDAIDTIDYLEWNPQIVTITDSKDTTQKFSWELRPTYLDNYILKGDRILLDILQQNFYSRPVYFSNKSDSSFNLFLSPFLKDEGLVSRVTHTIFAKGSYEIPDNLYKYNIDTIDSMDMAKSRDAVFTLNFFRWAYFYSIQQLTTQGNYEKAKELIRIMSEKFKKDRLPFASKEVEEYFTDYFDEIENNSN